MREPNHLGGELRVEEKCSNPILQPSDYETMFTLDLYPRDAIAPTDGGWSVLPCGWIFI